MTTKSDSEPPETPAEEKDLVGIATHALFGLGVQALQRRYGMNYVQASKLRDDLTRPVRHWPYRAAVMNPEAQKEVWWPVSSHDGDNMVIGDGIPGDKKSAELCARCCNIAYKQALEDVAKLMEARGLDAAKCLASLILPNAESIRAEKKAMNTNKNVIGVGCDALVAVGDVVEIRADCMTKGKRATVMEYSFGKIEVSFSPQWCGWYLPEQLRKISSANAESIHPETKP